MTAPRDLSSIIDQLFAIIPATETALRAELQAAKGSVDFAAPEMMSHWWRIVARILHQHIGEPSLTWHREVISLWVGVKS